MLKILTFVYAQIFIPLQLEHSFTQEYTIARQCLMHSESFEAQHKRFTQKNIRKISCSVTNKQLLVSATNVNISYNTLGQ